ncbi:DUF4232 domain-containing protein [Streptomyces sp. CA-294286]|uniref:DUF4232 domain-containing protein n=1 Tax=Streptomyces sp. CA-294286 TaxID=3240070 RepID=UPI003D8CD95A
MSARLVRTARRTRLFAASAVALTAVLSLTACDSGEGAKDAGAARTSSPSSAPSESADGSDGSDGKPTGAAEPGQTGGEAQQTSTTSGSAGNVAGKGNGQGGGTGTAGTAKTPGAKTDPDAPAHRDRCDASNITVTAQVVSRPLNTMILTATNKGAKLCDLYYAPVVRFEGAQSVPPSMKDTQPQAVVSLRPGASGYAAVKLSSPTGTPDPGYTAKSLSVGFYDAQHKNVGGFARAALPEKGVYVDSSLKVSFWNSDLDDISSL